MAQQTVVQFTESLDLFAHARDVIAGGSQTSSKRPGAYALGAYPIYAARASGSHIWDIDGNEYIDYVNGLGPIVLGYCYPEVDAAIAEQLEKGIIYGLLSPLEVAAADSIIDAVPAAEMVRFLKGGAEANNAAARIARAYTKREIILNNGYRGWSDGWSASRNDGGIPTALEQSIRQFTFNDLNHLEDQFRTYDNQVAAVTLDAASMGKEPEPGYLQGLNDLAHRHGALVIYDEIVTGFRLAMGGAQEYYGVTPDMATFAKAMANGMPLAAVVGSKEVMQAAENLVISITYGGEALSLAAAVATMNVMRKDNVHEHLHRTGELLGDGINAAAQRAGVALGAHGLAPIGGERFLDAADAEEEGLMWRFLLAGLAQRGVLIRRGGVNFITFSHTEEDVAQTCEALEDTLHELRRVRESGQLARVASETASIAT
ncbi:MAG: aminotransferase class III-fold pyridoxal phosphate-dependent enzyme [Chloroflexota bacterium]|nr:aminotransferase class III-fold pyridoxal phosphate-dependent enzyme [Chloroflexota bacterium]MDE2840007.1 aminotransferase class III-fold pyridoxal phosphate-dependent enzyme [Chloroflexota bacterium]MDE2930115.1 aminotransferase class III-fold pyridoxal phosphate-dependent enzyme [Chloroflexota bacterium]